MAENKYWFARRFPVGHPRNAMSPVTPEGWRIVRVFIGSMIFGFVGALALGVLGFWAWWLWPLAPVVFIGCSIYGAWYFISQAQGRGDHNHTVEDYKAGRV